MKSDGTTPFDYVYTVALFTRAWIEIDYKTRNPEYSTVALFTRAWIEITVIVKGTEYM